MPLRQIARTPSRPLPPREGHGIPYAFAVEIRRFIANIPAAPGDTPTDHPVVRCPWCGREELVLRPDAPDVACHAIGRRYTVAIPAGTPVLA